MKPITSRLYLLASMLLATLVIFLPWAWASFKLGEPGEMVSLPVHVMDPWIWMDGCPRVQVTTLGATLNIWVWLGRVVFLCHFLLWTAFLAALIRRKHLVEAVVGLMILGLMVFYLLASHPIVECLWIDFPPPLVFIPPWQISSISGLCLLAGLATAIQANLVLRRDRLTG